MKKLLSILLILISLTSCNKALEVRKSYTCAYMVRHPLKEGTGNIQQDYKREYKAFLWQSEIDSCLKHK